MTELKFDKFIIIGANLGTDNCLADIKNNAYIQAKISTTDRISEEETKYIGKGMIGTILPYQMQDGYDRTREEKYFDAAILENEYLKAIFIPELGGRLWSLYDKNAKRELLYVNPIFQPCNLGLRNAWFSGGTEWNVGIKGHTPLTCSPMFAREVICSDGTPMLKMYEFERIRQVCYSITAKLVKDMLLVNVMIENREENDKYMYWWSNIAVDEKEKTRVIVPAKEAFYCSYQENGYVLDKTTVPDFKGTDISYPKNLEVSRDFFFKIPEDEAKWIAAIHEDGYGLVHMSDDILSGRKYFAWGESQGGNHWGQWLSDSKDKYVEIQAGLLKTQLEHFVMKGNTTISWTESYSGIGIDPKEAHDKDMNVAVSAVRKEISDRQKVLNNVCFDVKEQKPIRYYGSGWGYLEQQARGEVISIHADFPAESLEDKQLEWLQLLEHNALSCPDTDALIKCYVKGEFWLGKLKEAEDSWYKFYHIGAVLCEKGAYDEAYEAFEQSIVQKPNAWSYRNLAQIDKNIRKDFEKACGHMEKAVALKDDYQPIWVDFAQAFIAAGQFETWIQTFEGLPAELKENGRLKVYYIQSLNETGRYEEAYRIINDNFVMCDVREGEYSVSRLFIEICSNLINKGEKKALNDEEVLAKYPLPYELDYRM